MKHWLILYDIRNPKRLRSVEKCVESYGWRVQKSVFESDAPDESIARLKLRLGRIINPEEDFVLFLDICERDWQKQETYGVGAIGEDRKMPDGPFIVL